MKLITLEEEALKRVYERHLTKAFPPSELKPLLSMEQLREQGLYDPLALVDENGEEQGYILLWRHGGGRYFLIDYLCVPESRRGNGIGGQLLSAMMAQFADDAVFIAESEAPLGDPLRDEMICRRLGFYRRNGGKILSYDTALFGVVFKTVCWAKEMPGEEEILRHHHEIYFRRFGRHGDEYYIQVPLAPGKQPYPERDWVEE